MLQRIHNRKTGHPLCSRYLYIIFLFLFNRKYDTVLYYYYVCASELFEKCSFSDATLFIRQKTVRSS